MCLLIFSRKSWNGITPDVSSAGRKNLSAPPSRAGSARSGRSALRTRSGPRKKGAHHWQDGICFSFVAVCIREKRWKRSDLHAPQCSIPCIFYVRRVCWCNFVCVSVILETTIIVTVSFTTMLHVHHTYLTQKRCVYHTKMFQLYLMYHTMQYTRCISWVKTRSQSSNKSSGQTTQKPSTLRPFASTTSKLQAVCNIYKIHIER